MLMLVLMLMQPRFTHVFRIFLMLMLMLVLMLMSKCEPTLTILLPLWLIRISLVFSYLSKVLFSDFLQSKGNFVDGKNNSKYRDATPLRFHLGVGNFLFIILTFFLSVRSRMGLCKRWRKW